jgi:flagellar motor switch protein FliG
MDPKNLAGSLKVAILLQSLGEEASRQILRSFDDSDRAVIENHLSQMGPISQDLVESIAQEFTGMASHWGILSKDDASKSTGGSQALTGSLSESSSLRALKSLEPEHLSKLIKDEHPQTIAIILAHLDPKVASKVLTDLPEETKSDVAVRIANLDKVMSDMVEEIDKVFESILKEKQTSSTHKLGGMNQLADILNQTTTNSAQLILEKIEKDNPELVAEIKQKMFVFDDLVLIDDKGLQKVLRNVETQELAVALKAASEDVKEKIFRNMSERAAEMLREEVEEMGPVRIKEVEDAQLNITKIIQDMEEKGELVISGRGGEEFV